MGRGRALGIIGCTILQAELLDVLAKDPELGHLLVIRNDAGLEFVDLANRCLAHVEVRLLGYDELASSQQEEGYSVVVDMRGTSLHRDPVAFREEVLAACKRLRESVSSILLFYGLCRNALWKMDRFAHELGVPVMVLQDQSGREVDDCFGAVMGGRSAYLQHIKENHGTLFIIPGYAEHWSRKLGSKDVVKALEAYENLHFVFERLGYDKVLRLDTHLGDHRDFERKVMLFSNVFGMSLSAEEGTLAVFHHSYRVAKAAMEGRGFRGQGDLDPSVVGVEAPF